MIWGAIFGTLPVAIIGMRYDWPTWLWASAALLAGGVLNMTVFAP